jgi:hypothetical protein
LKTSVCALFVLVIALDGCGAPDVDSATAKQHYLAAKDRCVADYPNSLVLQSDCRTRAANIYIRPFYKYGDLMTRAQEQRRALAVKADRHEITRKTYDRQIARSEAMIAREEERRDKTTTSTASVQDRSPFDGFFETIAGWLR